MFPALWLALLVFAFPFASFVHALPAALGARGLSQSLVDQLSYFEQYSAAAYCTDNNVAKSEPTISCEAGNCPDVQSAGAQSILEFQNVGITDATGFVAVDPAHKQIVVAFRGSQSLGNWIANLNIEMVPSGICSGCDAHAGFLDSWNGAKPLIQSALDTALTENPGFSIVATGHSLGAALATLMAADLRRSGYDIALYTYGSPMVGNAKLATFITNQSAANYRVTHANDIVPKLPGYFFGYAHVSPEYWVTSPTAAIVKASDIKTSSGVVNLKGNQGTLISSIVDHLWYFNDVTACGPIGIDIDAASKI